MQQQTIGREKEKKKEKKEKKKTCPDFGQKIRVRILGIVWTSALQLRVRKHGNCLA